MRAALVERDGVLDVAHVLVAARGARVPARRIHSRAWVSPCSTDESSAARRQQQVLNEARRRRRPRRSPRPRARAAAAAATAGRGRAPTRRAAAAAAAAAAARTTPATTVPAPAPACGAGVPTRRDREHESRQRISAESACQRSQRSPARCRAVFDRDSRAPSLPPDRLSARPRVSRARTRPAEWGRLRHGRARLAHEQPAHRERACRHDLVLPRHARAAVGRRRRRERAPARAPARRLRAAARARRVPEGHSARAAADALGLGERERRAAQQHSAEGDHAVPQPRARARRVEARGLQAHGGRRGEVLGLPVEPDVRLDGRRARTVRGRDSARRRRG